MPISDPPKCQTATATPGRAPGGLSRCRPESGWNFLRLSLTLVGHNRPFIILRENGFRGCYLCLGACGADMTDEFCDGRATLSDGARTLVRCGRLSYWWGVGLAIGCLVMAAIFTVVAKEPLSHRLVSLFVLGIVAGGLYGVGLVAFHGFRAAASVYDPVAIALSRILGSVAGAGVTTGKRLMWFATIILPRLIESGRRWVDWARRWSTQSMKTTGTAVARLSRDFVAGLTYPIRVSARGLIRLQNWRTPGPAVRI